MVTRRTGDDANPGYYPHSPASVAMVATYHAGGVDESYHVVESKPTGLKPVVLTSGAILSPPAVPAMSADAIEHWLRKEMYA